MHSLSSAASFDGYRGHQHPIDAAAVHLNDLELVAVGGDSVGDHRNAVEPRHQIAAERVKIRILAGQVRQTQHLLQFVEPDHAVDQPAAIITPHNPLIGVASSRNVAYQRLENVARGHQTFEIALFVDDQRHRFPGAFEHVKDPQN